MRSRFGRGPEIRVGEVVLGTAGSPWRRPDASEQLAPTLACSMLRAHFGPTVAAARRHLAESWYPVERLTDAEVFDLVRSYVETGRWQAARARPRIAAPPRHREATAEPVELAALAEPEPLSAEAARPEVTAKTEPCLPCARARASAKSLRRAAASGTPFIAQI